MFPNLPTDNLYKFLGLSGIVIILTSSYVLLITLIELEEKIIDTKEQQRISVEKNRESSERLEEFGKIAERLAAIKKKKKLPQNADKSVLQYYSGSDLKKLDEKLHQSFHQRIIETINTEFNAQRVESLKQRAEQLKYASIFFNIFGFVLSLVGFTLWYRKVQKPQDMLLQSELEKSKSNQGE